MEVSRLLAIETREWASKGHVRVLGERKGMGRGLFVFRDSHVLERSIPQ